MRTQDSLDFQLPKEIVSENQAIKNHLLNHELTRGKRSFYFCSATPGEGTSTVVLSLAMTLAQCCSLKVLLAVFNDGSHRLAEQLLGKEASAEMALHDGGWFIASTRMSGLSIAFFNEDQLSTEGVSSLGRLLSERCEEFDVQLVDGPCFQVVPDISLLRNSVDGAVLLIQSGKCRAEVLASVKERLTSSGIQLVGAILNKRKKTIPGYLYRRL